MIPELKNAYVRLRPVVEADARFILDLRMDERRNKHLSVVVDDLQKQVAWIQTYKEREREGCEYYFAIETLEGMGLGAVRMYDLRADSFCWGSWIIRLESPAPTAISSALLIYAFGFEELGYPQSHFDVRKTNQKVIDFHLRTGAKVSGEDDDNYYFIFGKDAHVQLKSKYSKFLRSKEGS